MKVKITHFNIYVAVNAVEINKAFKCASDYLIITEQIFKDRKTKKFEVKPSYHE